MGFPSFVRLRILRLVIPLAAVVPWPAAPSVARADLKETGSPIFTISGKPNPGQVDIKYTATDPNGTQFILKVIDNEYIQGFVVKDKKEIKFGRCIYDFGLNDQSFYINPDNSFNQIVWANVKPVEGLTLADVREKENESADAYEKRIDALVKKFGTERQFYNMKFSLGDQTIDWMTSDSMGSITLTPDEAASAYALPGGLSILQLDPSMADGSDQQNYGDVQFIPLPNAAVMGFCLLGMLGVWRCLASTARLRSSLS